MLKHIATLALVALISTGCALTAKNSAQEPNTGRDRVPISDTAAGGYAIRLTSPQQGQVLKSPFLVGGEAAVPGGAVYIRVKNPAGDVVISEQTRVQGERGPFGVLISFVFQATEEGTVEVYGIDPATGGEVALESVSVNFDTSGSGSARTDTQ